MSICWLALGAFCADLSVLVFGLEEERGKGVFVALRWLAGGERGPGGRSRSNFVVLFAGGRCCCLRYHMVEDSELKECRLGVTVLENYKPVRGGGGFDEIFMHASIEPIWCRIIRGVRIRCQNDFKCIVERDMQDLGTHWSERPV